MTTDSQAYCWGYGPNGQLGNGTIGLSYRPVAVLGGLKFRSVSVGYGHSCGVTTDFKAYCWGDNSNGQLGDGTTTSHQLSPVLVVGGYRFRQISAGGSHTCALTYSDQRAYCWGYNSAGELGDGTLIERHAPVPVRGGRQFSQLDAGGQRHTCAVTVDYQAFCWGENSSGQLGDSTRTLRSSPVLVVSKHRFRQVSAGGFHTCAVTPRGEAFCWGENAEGQLGNGTTFRARVPRRVSGDLNVDRVTAGEYFTCAETSGNLAYCWGNNQGGQLTDGTRAERLTPVPVTGGLHFSQVTAGGWHACGKTPEAVGYCWGEDAAGQLGIGDETGQNRYTPVPIASPGK